ncbi:tetratricopeptide repeat protein [Roseomonas sp. GC11]|uniref:tetratricopeptide repeat protein n=1 Tax=Roseomonas sp. GC11 TaxID=2950546 RepID=UPI00210DFC3E|nr:tetratricopeptide repeat protein [Roseomonas sp. GC11]MCQ4162643.1 tetratricopeptide repeat protein [Roseomonas sp. GC11]
MTSHILYEDEHLLVVHHPADGPFTLITFADMSFRPKEHVIWGQDPAGKLGLNAIGFVPKAENWYPTASVEKAAPAVRAALRGPAITYGYSMGGHGALKHAARLGAEAVLAVSPQDSIDPAEVPWDTRFHKYHDPALHAGMAVRPGEAGAYAVVMADPYLPEDHGQTTRLCERLGAHWVRAPFMDHAAIWRLADHNVLGEALRLALAQDAPGLFQMLRGRRRVSRRWVRQMAAAAMRRGHLRMANRLWRHGRRIGIPANITSTDVQRHTVLRIQALRAQKRQRKARDLALFQPRAWPQDTTLGLRLAAILHNMGEMASCERLYREILGRHPQLVAAYEALGKLLVSQKKQDEAVALCLEALEHMPEQAELRLYLARLLLDLGRAEEAEAQFRTLLEHTPHHPQALLGLSHSMAARGERQAAAELAREAVRELRDDPEACLWLGQLLLYLGEPYEAEPIFRTAVQGLPERAEAHIGWARALERTGHHAAAQRVAAAASATMPEDLRLQALTRRLGPPEEEEREEQGPPPSRLRLWLREFFSPDPV